MKIYSNESDIKNFLESNRISFASQIKKGEADDVVSSQLFKFATATNRDQPDLYYMDSILVSVGINKNDDYFDAEEVWEARKTPEDKQINYEHNEKDIIGHITSCYAVDDQLKRIPDDVVSDKLPDKFHIITGGVLYKKWEDDDLKQRMGEMIDSIEAGELFVSMECLFNDFDYILIEENGKAKIVERNTSTSFLTKKLRAYGGDGVYQNKRIGRVIRNITFSGKGIVKKPANPDSVIFSETHPVLVKASENNGDEFIMKIDSEVTAKVEPSAELQAMASEVKELKQLLADERTAKAEAKAQAERDVKAKAERDLLDLQNSLKAKDTEIESLKTKLEDSAKALEASTKKVEDAEKSAKSAQDELTKIAAAKKTADRIAALTKAGKSEDDAKTLEKKFAAVDDDAFAAIVENLTASVTTENEGDDDEDEAAEAKVLENLEKTKTQPGTKAKASSTLDDVFKATASMWSQKSRFAKKQS